MPEQPPSLGPLTDSQATRVEFAQHDLAEARTADLATMDGASLILLVESMRMRLDDMLALLRELSE